MLVFLALSVAVSAVSATYGSGSTYNRPSYSSNPVYYPPAVYDSHYWDYSSRERHHKECPKITTFAGQLPGIPAEAFYPPVIRYVKYGRNVHALISCDKDPKNVNFLFARHNSSRDVRQTNLIAMGSTAGVVVKCDRDERRYEGIAIDLYDEDDYSKTVDVTQVTCMGLDNSAIGLLLELAVREFSTEIFAFMNFVDFFNTGVPAAPVIPPVRRKRDVSDVSTSAPAEETANDITAEATDAPTTGAAANNEVTETPSAPAAVTDKDTENSTAASDDVSEAAKYDVTDAPDTTEAPAPGSPEAVKQAAAKLGAILGRIFHK
ncbi:hypothetical protein L5515_007969 [Caenorhabditis briggsae]|uniref:Uncharacterized protein n=1 Tax=Caenorhabditis briggsae TaxID=6238 RepID=A0AAE9F017_CAEBR|nr:hypothetical protein L5515_007969 [Caenorhabditis briggsae]